MWILRCFGHDHQVLCKSRMVWCQKWNACNAGQMVDLMCKTEVLMKNSQIWYMNAQVEVCMLNHEETCFNPKWSHFHDIWMINENPSQCVFVDLMESLIKKNVSSLMKYVLNSSEKWWSEWKIWVLKHESVSHLKILFLEWKLA